MPFTIMINGVQVICESPTDALALAQAVPQQQRSAGPAIPPKRMELPGVRKARRITGLSTNAWAKLSDEAKALGAWFMHRFDSRTLEVEMAAKTIAQDLGWSARKVSRSTAQLRQKWIHSVKGRYANRYKLNSQHIEAGHGGQHR